MRTFLSSLLTHFVLILLGLMVSLTVAQSATIQELTTTDVLGYTCVAEEDLDAAFLNQGKGGTVPQTCITETPVKDCESLTILLGREASYEECGIHAYRYLTWLDPERKLGWGFGCKDCVVISNPPIPPTSAVPLPATAFMLLGAIGLLTLVRRSS